RLDVTPANRTPHYETASLIPFLGGERTGDAIASDDTNDDALALADEPSGSDEKAAEMPRDCDRTGGGLSGNDGAAPDFQGASLREALGIARAHSVTITTSGSGYVVRQ